MKTLIIYDASGRIWVQMSGSYAIPEGLTYLEVEVQDGKFISGVDVTVIPNVAIIGDAPKSDTLTRLELLENVVNGMILA